MFLFFCFFLQNFIYLFFFLDRITAFFVSMDLRTRQCLDKAETDAHTDEQTDANKEPRLSLCIKQGLKVKVGM